LRSANGFFFDRPPASGRGFFESGADLHDLLEALGVVRIAVDEFAV
jgi:hypothetical protein